MEAYLHTVRWEPVSRQLNVGSSVVNVLSVPSFCLVAGSAGAFTGVRETAWLFQVPFDVNPLPGGPLIVVVVDDVDVVVGPVW
jgi:hypothetical protein